jgi:hypothetical protein
MKQKLLLITSLTLLIAGFSVAQVEDDVLLIPKAGEAPVIDGQMDDIWKNVVEVMAEVPDLLNAANRETWWDLWAGFRLLWDDENLYVWVNVNDDSINPGTDWQNDSVEFYFDGDNSKTPGDYDAFDDSQVRFNFGETTPAEVNFGGGKTWGGTTSDNWEYIFVETEVGYNLELKIPLADIRLDIGPDLEFGFDIQLNDADETTRDMVYRWWTDDDNAWQDASLFGTAKFIGRTVSEVLDIHKAAAAPTIDAVMGEGEWDNATIISGDTPDSLTPITICNDWTDARQHAYLMWDDTNFYLYLKVWDDLVNPGTDWQNDSAELYFDGDNSKTPGDYDAFDDSQVRFNIGETTPAEVNFGGGKTWGGTTSDAWVYTFMETDVGWDMELKIPLAEVRMDIGPDQEFGFDIQLNDADASTRDMVLRWWTDNDNAWQDASLFGTAMFVEGGTAVDPDIGHATNFSLSQNYPNPFNPETSIQYSVGSESMVRLTVYDLLGNQVAELVHEQQPAGQYTAVFDGSGLASGMYFYRLQTGDKIITRKMTLLQ